MTLTSKSIFIEKFIRKSEFVVYMFDLMNKCLVSNLTKGRLSYHLFVECFSQLSFDSEVHTKSATAAEFVYTLNQMRVVKNIRCKEDKITSL